MTHSSNVSDSDTIPTLVTEEVRGLMGGDRWGEVISGGLRLFLLFPRKQVFGYLLLEQDSKSSVAITLSTPTKNAKPARRRGLKTLSVLAQDADSTCPLGLQLFSLPQFPWMASIT